MPTEFFLFPQAASQSESESEKASLCDVPSSSPSVSPDMGRDCAQSSAVTASEDVDKEDEFGYSWSKLSLCDALKYTKFKNSFSLVLYEQIFQLWWEILQLYVGKLLFIFLEYNMHSWGMISRSSFTLSAHFS